MEFKNLKINGFILSKINGKYLFDDLINILIYEQNHNTINYIDKDILNENIKKLSIEYIKKFKRTHNIISNNIITSINSNIDNYELNYYILYDIKTDNYINKNEYISLKTDKEILRLNQEYKDLFKKYKELFINKKYISI